ncbi:hypothetical protein Q9K01_13160 [Qipengyuania sp. DY56-A-20]|uniref:Surface carbohydrate biosynthesis protein n=1 Tax=Qipengyuania benthica TaxID=3067651 RepID=A0ABT9HB65_9SPHN|nr:surface carbohydrate biosynthesis protein [Qipengyuania sp. DY56-A-20]MDP4540575.1 hypothetical protein [Qipengyuania sp. DY56-A-20]
MAAQNPSCRIGLIVDHPSRDLPGMVMLGLELSRRGIETALVPLYDQGLDVPLLELSALVLNFARQVNEPIAREYHRLGIPLFVLDTEGGILSDQGRVSPQAIAAYVRDSGFGGLLEGYFLWGEAMREAFLEARALSPDQLHLTGCPRFDYYTPMWATIEPPKRQGHILVNTNFPVVNSRFAEGRQGDAAALRSVGFDDTYIEQLQTENGRVMAGIIALVARLANDLPNRQFVLRPHPFERREAYCEAFAELSNVVVDGDGPVLEALRGAHALVHCNCGTAVEALMLNLPPLSPEWINSDFLRSHASLPSKASRKTGSYEEIRQLIASSDPAAGFDMAAVYHETVHPYFHHNDGKATQRVADVLVDHCRGEMGPKPRSYKMALRGSSPHPRFSQRIQGLAANLLGSARARDLRARYRPARAHKRFTPERVQHDIDLLVNHTGACAPSIQSGRHPVTGARLSSVIISAREVED